MTFRLVPVVLSGVAWLACAQTPAVDRIAVPLTDPARPVTLSAALITGGIHVKTGPAKEVIVEARARGREAKDAAASREGMRRITVSSTGLEVEEENNTVRVNAASHSRAVDLEIQVPVRTSLKLKTINDGDIVVDGVQGDIEATNINGNVTLNKVGGSAVAHALNGEIKVTFTQIDGQKAMSFSSMNGDIDVTFPATLKANVKVKSDQGEIFSDFDMALAANPKPVVEDSRNNKGKYKVKIDRGVTGTINGGGPEIQFSNMNGAIYIRRAGAR
ncbi:MAG: DUF4097 family beta strand repeat protein [Bryobacterales bacterium]|nr:DUF4097 family beta strand repeat protein [Bryobacterales bacterium]